MVVSMQTGLKGALLLLTLVVFAVLTSLFFAPRADAASLTVTSNANEGPGTLRAAVDTANANGEPDTITFDLPQGQRTITLSEQIGFFGGQETTVDGANDVTVSGGDATRVFYIFGGNLTLEEITVAGGDPPTTTVGAPGTGKARSRYATPPSPITTATYKEAPSQPSAARLR